MYALLNIMSLIDLIYFFWARLLYPTDHSKDFLDLLNFPESPDHTGSTPLRAEQISAENSSAHPLSFPLTDIRCFQKDLLKLMMDGIKIGLVSDT